MHAGAYFRNGADTFQIDDTFANLAFGSVANVVASTAYGTFGIGARTLAGDNPMLALRPTAGYACVMSIELPGGQYQYNLLGSEQHLSIPTYAFDAPGAPPENLGLELFDAAGKRTFHSAFRYMRVVEFLLDVNSYSSSGEITWTGEPGRTYAVVYCRPLVSILQAPVGPNPGVYVSSFWFTACRVDGATVRFKSFIVHTEGGTNTTGTLMSPCPVLIVDVTGF